MMRMRSVLAVAFLSGTTFASSISYVVLEMDNKENSIVRIGADGAQTTIASNATGLGMTVDHDGNYIVAADHALLRVTPAGVVKVIAQTPPNAEWRSVSVNAAGELIVADGLQPSVWRVSADGQSVTKAASYATLVSGAGGYQVGLTIDSLGDYWVLAQDLNFRTGPEAGFYHITPSGMVTRIPLSGIRVGACLSIILDGAGNFLFTDPRLNPSKILRVTPAGVVSVFAEIPDARRLTALARNPAAGEIVTAAYDGGLISVSADGSKITRLSERPALSRATAIVVELNR